MLRWLGKSLWPERNAMQRASLTSIQLLIVLEYAMDDADIACVLEKGRVSRMAKRPGNDVDDLLDETEMRREFTSKCIYNRDMDPGATIGSTLLPGQPQAMGSTLCLS